MAGATSPRYCRDSRLVTLPLQGLRVRVPDGVSLQDRILASQGHREPSNVDNSDTPYCAGAQVPIGPWRPLKPGERDAFADNERPSWRTIGLLQLPAMLANQIQAGVADFAGSNEASRHCDVYCSREVVDAMIAFAQHLSTRPQGFRVLGKAVHESGLWTTTSIEDRKGRLGIHMDSWDGLSFNERAGGRNRLCFNLGRQPRYLLFINHTITDIAQELGLDPAQQHGATDALRAWLRINPHVPAFRLRIDPGEAYIAPTEMIPHDSTTYECRGLDVSFAVLGNFPI